MIFTSVKLLCAAIVFSVMVSFDVHKFYVSKTNITFNQQSRIYEVIMRLSTKDIEAALARNSDTELHFGTEDEDINTNLLIEKYINANFNLRFNGQPTTLLFVGKETEGEITFCYWEFAQVGDYATLSIANTMFFEIFEEQKNVVDLEVGGTTKTIILTPDHPYDIFYR